MWIDAHSHVDRYGLINAQALASALVEIEQHRIWTVSNSIDLPSYQHNLRIAERCHLVLPIFGVHPWAAQEYADRLQDLDAAIEQTPMIGEIGLDYFFVEDAAAYPDQRKVFEYFLRAAREQGKLVCLHTKGAEREVLELLERHDVHGEIVHWYSGPLDIFRQWVARGAYFTVGIEVLHVPHIQQIAREIPLARLLTETDDPGGPSASTGAPGTPALVQEVVRGLAAARNTTVEAILSAVQCNFTELIRGNAWLARSWARVLAEPQTG